MKLRYCLSLVALLAFTAVASADEKRPPNVVIIMADDMGYAGLSCSGNTKFKTPHLDALAAEGLHETEVGWVSEPVLRWSVMAIQLHCDD